jgi:hypothetical protein
MKMTQLAEAERLASCYLDELGEELLDRLGYCTVN